MSPALTLLFCTSLIGAPFAEPGTLLVYEGEIVAEKGEPALTRKEFSLTVLIVPGEDGPAAVWSVSEKGRGQWAWPDRFGRIEIAAAHRGDGAVGPALLYQGSSGASAVPLYLPVLAAEKPLAKGDRWREGRLNYEVKGSEKHEGKSANVVEASNLYGVRQRILVSEAAPVVLAMNEEVFIGQGERHDLTYKLKSRGGIDQAELDKATTAFAALAELREKLELRRRLPRVDFTDEQIALIKDALPAVEKLAAETPLKPLLADIRSESFDQAGRAGAVAELKKRIIGKPSPAVALDGTSGETLTADDLKGKVAVLHFWEYRGEPLEEPYGQVGYLDFLYRRYKEEGVVVYGVNVDERLADPSARRSSIASAKKLKSFMNLSYPVMLDSGRTLSQFGDPRRAGAKLPLFIVIGKDGNVLEYHSGYFEVSRDQGLKSLDELVKKALE